MWTTMKNTIRPITDGALSSWRLIFQSPEEATVDGYEVRTWMRQAPSRLTEEDSVLEAAKLLEKHPLVHVPVYDSEGAWLGMVSHREIIRQLGLGKTSEDLGTMPVTEIMEAEPEIVKPSFSLSRAVQLMREKEVSCLPVVCDGIFLGVLTEAEVLKAVDTFHMEGFSLAA
jgi:CBS domain-containing protein